MSIASSNFCCFALRGSNVCELIFPDLDIILAVAASLLSETGRKQHGELQSFLVRKDKGQAGRTLGTGVAEWESSKPYS